MLVVAPSGMAPSQLLPGPAFTDGGRKIPVGCVPWTSPEDLATFARTAAKVHAREKQTCDVAVLGQWLPRFSQLAQRIETLLRDDRPDEVFKWTSDVIYKEDMVKGLHTGIAAAIYVGHGRPIGWVGYYGTRIHELTGKKNEPLAAMLSLTCLTASRKNTDISFAEWLPLRGVAASAFGAVSATVHTDNTRWAVNICEALKGQPATIGALITGAMPERKSAANAYRLTGDPLSPLLSAAGANRKAGKIKVFT
jgi:hypothetical protein